MPEKLTPAEIAMLGEQAKAYREGKLAGTVVPIAPMQAMATRIRDLEAEVAHANEAMQCMGLMHEMEMSRLRAERDTEAMAADWFGEYTENAVAAYNEAVGFEKYWQERMAKAEAHAERLEKALRELVASAESDVGYVNGDFRRWRAAVDAAKEVLG